MLVELLEQSLTNSERTREVIDTQIDLSKYTAESEARTSRKRVRQILLC